MWIYLRVKSVYFLSLQVDKNEVSAALVWCPSGSLCCSVLKMVHWWRTPTSIVEAGDECWFIEVHNTGVCVCDECVIVCVVSFVCSKQQNTKNQNFLDFNFWTNKERSGKSRWAEGDWTCYLNMPASFDGYFGFCYHFTIFTVFHADHMALTCIVTCIVFYVLFSKPASLQLFNGSSACFQLKLVHFKGLFWKWIEVKIYIITLQITTPSFVT